MIHSVSHPSCALLLFSPYHYANLCCVVALKMLKVTLWVMSSCFPQSSKVKSHVLVFSKYIL